MKIFFLSALIWEFIRFFILAPIAVGKIDGMVLWVASSHCIIFYLYFFLWYNTDKYCQFMKPAVAGKFLAIVTGLFFLAEIINNKSTVLNITLVINIILIDGLFLFLTFFFLKQYFNKLKGV